MKRSPGLAVWSVAAGALFALGLAVWTARSLAPFLERSPGYFDMSYVDMGEGLLHAAHPSYIHVSYRLPLGPLIEALSVIHSSPAMARFLVGLSVVFCLLLLFALGAMLGSPWCGLLSVALWESIFQQLPMGPGFHKQLFFTPFVLLVAAITAWRAREPSPGKSLILGCAIGISLLYRSTLAFFPPLLAFYEWAVDHRFSLKRYWRHLLPLCLAPYLFLIPWIRMNWILHREFVPFEHGAANMNIVTGALGIVTCAHGDFRLLMDRPPTDGYGSVLGWAFQEVLRRPLRYAGGVWLRLAHAFSLHPLLFLLALLALALLRGRRGFRESGLLCLYFLGINCLMSVENDYFEPLWPVLSALAAALPLGFKRSKEENSPAVESSKMIIGAGFALAAGLGLFALGAVNAYAKRTRLRPPDSRAALEEALARNPEDAWLLFERGKSRLGRGETQGAVQDLSQALRLRPEIPRIGLELAWARMELGDFAPLMNGSFTRYPEFDALNDNIKEKASVYKALGSLRLGRKGEAREHLEKSLEIWRESQTFLHETQPPQEREADEKLRSGSDARFAGKLEQWLYGKPAGARLSALRALAEMRPDEDLLWKELARLAIEKGDLDLATRSMARLEKIARDPQGLHELSFLYQDIRKFDKALAVLERLTRKYPRALFFKDRGVCEYRGGLADRAILSFKTAMRLDPGLLEAHLSLGTIYAMQKRYAEALQVYDMALARKTGDARIRGLIAESRREALSSLGSGGR